ncbi:hypothetical protein ACJMK2_021225 [Sinanodonta woodiana]|uniref:HECT-type E3 ubiquitin transferase n=1 Tax=Sinanodonta woodiana TaxID=1069815 RepID=A0ABD3U485_SINWO
MAEILRQILDDLSLSLLFQNFVYEKIDSIETCKNLTDVELSRLGISTIGDRVRFREKIKQAVTPTEHVLSSERTNLFHTGRARHMTQASSRRNTKGRTWTVTFVCLADRNACKVPSTSQKSVLQRAGLGPKKITFQGTDSELEVHSKLISSDGFPQLSTAGGFELLYCQSNCRQIEVLKCRWNVDSFKASLGSQAKIYVRPIQKNLSTEPIIVPEESAVKARCVSCNRDYIISNLRDHVSICSSSVADSSHNEPLQDEQYLEQPLDEAAELPDIETVQLSRAENVAIQPHHHAEHNQGLEHNVPNIEDIVKDCVQYCTDMNMNDPVAILQYLQSRIVTGRKLELENEESTIEGETSFIIVDRNNLTETALDEIRGIVNLRLTLEVQFYGETAVDYGGPRKEFFSMVLRDIQKEYFDPVREWSNDYEVIGKIFALSILQNGRLPRILGPDLVEELFNSSSPRPFLQDLRKGLDALGLFQLTCHLPSLKHFFTPGTPTTVTLKMVTNLLQPIFSPDGSNRRQIESYVYAKFVKYLREAAGGRRGDVTLAKILTFVTGTEEEPVLGFQIKPSIAFQSSLSLLPTSNTCVNRLNLTIPDTTQELPTDDILFSLFDYAFSNSFFGLV